MAGLGRKTFAALDVLTAAQVNGYLMDQSVMVFASAASRSSSIATASTGMATYLTDVKQFQVYNGTTWTQISGSGGGPDFLLMGA
jgi:hypothetical protein